ncbi:MAG: ABC transporter substrate-binding protein [Thermoleophilia bacterium]
MAEGDRQGFLHNLGSKPLTRRQILKGAAALGAGAALAPALAACGDSSSPSSSASTSAAGIKRGGSLKVGITTGSGKEGFDPHVLSYEPEIANGFNMHNRLVEFTPDYQLENILAEEVTGNTDATVWTVRLKDGIMFSDGQPVTADDVVFSFNRIINPKDPKNGATLLQDLSPSGIKKVDDRTVEFSLDRPNAIFREILAHRENNIVPADFDIKKPIGTGPFKLKSYTIGQQTVLVPNENYWGDGPYVDELTIVQYADPTARVNALLSGAIDHCDQLEAAQVQVVKGASGYDVWETKSGGYFPFTMRVDVKPFDDERVRQAFRLIVDRQQMLEQAYGGFGWIGNDMYAPFDPGYPSDLPQRTQDFEQAKALLKAAGQEGMTIELNTSDAVGSGAVAAAQVFAEQAKGAGVNVKVMKRTSDVFYGDMYLQWVFAMDYWGTRNYLAQTRVGTSTGAQWNETHWGEDPEWKALVDEAFQTVDDTKRNELIAQASEIEYNKGGLIIWSFNSLRDGYSTKLSGLVNDVFQSTAIGFRYWLLHYT